jgi:hypothetical protein
MNSVRKASVRGTAAEDDLEVADEGVAADDGQVRTRVLRHDRDAHIHLIPFRAGACE